MKPAISPNLLAAIDTIAQVLAKQRQRSVFAEEDPMTREVAQRCKYRGDNGCMCAIGAVMPEDAYFPDLEGAGAASLLGTVGTDHPLYQWLDTLKGESDGYTLGTALGRIQRFHDHICSEETDGAPTYTMMLIVNEDRPDEVLAADIKAELLRRVSTVYEVPAQ